MQTQNKDLDYYRKNAEEDYLTTPISVLRYISEMEAALRQPLVSGSLPLDKLRQKLDEALAKETPETLIKWLEEKRQ
jgi:hypothetical protein